MFHGGHCLGPLNHIDISQPPFLRAAHLRLFSAICRPSLHLQVAFPNSPMGYQKDAETRDPGGLENWRHCFVDMACIIWPAAKTALHRHEHPNMTHPIKPLQDLSTLCLISSVHLHACNQLCACPQCVFSWLLPEACTERKSTNHRLVKIPVAVFVVHNLSWSWLLPFVFPRLQRPVYANIPRFGMRGHGWAA